MVLLVALVGFGFLVSGGWPFVSVPTPATGRLAKTASWCTCEWPLGKHSPVEKNGALPTSLARELALSLSLSLSLCLSL